MLQGKPAGCLERAGAQRPLLERRRIASSCLQQGFEAMQGHRCLGPSLRGLLGIRGGNLIENKTITPGHGAARAKGATNSAGPPPRVP